MSCTLLFYYLLSHSNLHALRRLVSFNHSSLSLQNLSNMLHIFILPIVLAITLLTHFSNRTCMLVFMSVYKFVLSRFSPRNTDKALGPSAWSQCRGCGGAHLRAGHRGLRPHDAGGQGGAHAPSSRRGQRRMGRDGCVSLSLPARGAKSMNIQ